MRIPLVAAGLVAWFAQTAQALPPQSSDRDSRRTAVSVQRMGESHTERRDRGRAVAVDSVAAHRAARRAQTNFESRRRQLLPVTFGGSGGRCDVRIGRFCYWHDDGEVTLPEEPLAIARSRDELVARLDSAGGKIPGDGWIAGQRVRYLVESARLDEATEVARGCEGEAWWCAALLGFARHAADDAAGADSAFAAALAVMPDARRCEWEDVGSLLHGRAASRYRDLSCVDRRQFGHAFWWLAQPLWSLGGNDRRSEHYSRHVMSVLERESRSPYGLSWGEDTHDLVVRYGWPTRWSRNGSSRVDLSSVHVIGHEPSPAFDFIPDDTALLVPATASVDAWEFRRLQPDSRYAPRYARAFVAMDIHVARFTRGDSMLLVAVGEVPGDTVLQRDSLESAFVVANSPGDPWTIVRTTSRSRRTPVWLTTRAESALVSLEVRDSARREVGRARLAIHAPSPDSSGSWLSDLLLFEDPTPDDVAIDQFTPRLTTATAIPPGSRVGVYWELSRGTLAADSVTYTLTVTPKGPGLLRRLASRVGLAATASPVHMRFTEPLSAGGRTSRSLTVDLSTLPAGEYDLRVGAESDARSLGASSRAIRIGRRR